MHSGGINVPQLAIRGLNRTAGTIEAQKRHLSFMIGLSFVEMKLKSNFPEK